MKGWVLIALGLIVSVALTSAQTQLPWYVVGSGGNIGAVSGLRVLSGTIGQPIIGISVSTTGSAVSQGFWLPVDATLVGVDEEDRPVDYSAQLSNYPNPFSNTTTIRFGTPVEGALMVRVFDLVGNLVRTLNVEASLAGGTEIQFDGLDQFGGPLGEGTYVYEITGKTIDSRSMRSVQRMMILR